VPLLTRAEPRARLGAEAQAETKKAALDQAELNLGYTVIVAPVNGVVTNRTVEVGQNVSIGQELMKVINLDDIWVTANFKETQLKHMQIRRSQTGPLLRQYARAGFVPAITT
jgi:membrane fusion protein (multidrug efflux system)